MNLLNVFIVFINDLGSDLLCFSRYSALSVKGEQDIN